MKVASWNVNSLNVRLPHVLKWLEQEQPDILALQETKMTDDKFPILDIKALDYEVIFTGQKTYNGVAILSRKKLLDPIYELSGFEDQKRFISGVYNGIRIVNVYVPNGASVGSDKFHYKLRWLEQLKEQLEQDGKF